MRALTLALVLAYATVATAEPAPARVRALVFALDGARANATVHSGAASAPADGTASLDVAAGPVALTLRVGDAESALPALTLAAGEEATLVITVDEAGRVIDVDSGSDPADAAPSAPAVAPITGSSDSSRFVEVTISGSLDRAPRGGVRCFVQGVPGVAGITGPDGRAVLSVRTGPARVSFVHAGSSPRIVDVPADAVTLDVELLPAAAELDELNVRAPRIEGGLGEAVRERREEKQVVEVIGAEQMKRAGDGDAAAALKRAAGLTVVGGRYVYVRGLGERYSTTLLDGATLPSPEPERRVVPLDMFPTGALSSVLVQKTWSPELPGDFGGGAVLLRTRRVPERRFLDLSLGAVGTLGTTFAPSPVSRGGAFDFLGFDDGSRAMPAELRAASEAGVVAEGSSLTPGGSTAAQLEHFGESLSRTYEARTAPLAPSASLGVTFGDKLSFPAFDIGAIGALSWSQDWQHSVVERRRYAVGGGGELTELERAVVDGTNRNVATGGLLSLGLEGDGHALQSTTFVQRITDDDTRVLAGFDRDVNTDVRATRLGWIERTLLSERIAGDHALPSAFGGARSVLSWRYGWALAMRDEPDLRETRFDLDPNSDTYLLSDRPEGNQRLFSQLGDQSHDAEVAWRTPLPSLVAKDEGLLHVGLAATTKARDVDTRRFKFLHKGARATDAGVRARGADDIFTAENIGADGFQLAESTRKTDNYAGSSTIGGAFAAVTMPLPAGVTLTGGARLEAAHIDVTTFELFNAAATPSVATLDSIDVLPSLGATWAFAPDMQLRAAVARTVARPELRELSPAVFTDVTAGRSRFGNPELQPAALTHVDARWEWYPSATESVSLAAFGKHFASPVETVITPGADQSITYENAAGAVNVGLEVEARVGLGFVHPVVDAFSVAGNGALIWSEVQLPEDGIHTSRARPLEGQSPWVANAQLAWDPAEGSTVTLLYNVFGPRIRDVGVLGAPDVYEAPLHQLDLVVQQSLPWGLSFTAKAANLLDGETLLTQGGELMERSRRGPSLSLSLGLAL